MEIRAVPLPPDIEYVLDAAGEGYEITAAAYAAVRLHGDIPTITSIIDRERNGDDYTRRRLASAFDIEMYGHSIIRQLPIARQSEMVLLGVHSLLRHVRGIADYLLIVNFEDETLGGANKPFRRPVRCRSNFSPTPRVARRLYSPRAIRNFVRQQPEVIHLRGIFSSLISLSFSPGHYGAVSSIGDDMQRQITMNRQAMQRAAQEARLGDDVLSIIKKPKPQKAVRSRLKKAASIAAAILGSSAVSAFARGEPVMIRGEHVTFAVSARGSLDHSGHGALTVAVHDPAGPRLSNLCIYQDDTPALDQLASIALHVAAGDEMEVLTIGNLYDIQPAANEHPVIALRQRLKGGAPAMDAAASERIGFALSSGDMQRMRVNEYRTAVEEIYREAIATQVFGSHQQGFMKRVLASMER